MVIALISFEFLDEIHISGIGTYMGQLANLLIRRGHQVEVFCANSKICHTYEKAKNLIVHTVKCQEQKKFQLKVLGVFQARLKHQNFHIIEANEIFGASLLIRQHYPAIPHLIKLHCSVFFYRQLNERITWQAKLRYRLGGLRRGQWDKKPHWKYIKEDDKDYQIARLCPYILHPSESMKQVAQHYWGLAEHRFIAIPNPFIATPQLLNIPIKNKETDSPTILYIGRLEIGKGLLELARDLPLVLKQFPKATLTLIGAAKKSPKKNLNMQQYLEQKLKKYRHQISFLGHLEYEQIGLMLEQADICVFPSHWDNFPTVCLEAMSAGRAIIGSCHGGMKEMLSDNCGIIIDPFKNESISKAMLQLIRKPQFRKTLGENARKKILTTYSEENIGNLIESTYQMVIDNWGNRPPIIKPQSR